MTKNALHHTLLNKIISDKRDKTEATDVTDTKKANRQSIQIASLSQVSHKWWSVFSFEADLRL